MLRFFRRAALRPTRAFTFSALVAGLLLAPQLLEAWGREGHRTIALIAEKHLTNKTATRIHDLLGKQSIADVASWADEVRNQPEYKGTGPWHFVNLPLGLSYEDFVQQLTVKTEPNAYQALNEQLRILRDKKQPQAKRVDALKFVVHLVGDIHEPMHVSRAEDKGGNDIQVQFQDEGSNLHRLWDSGLIHAQGQPEEQMAAALDHPEHSLVLQWSHDPITKWLYESYQLSTEQYAEVPTGSKLDQQYFQAHIGEVQQRMQQAGIRLAQVLNEALDK